MSPHWHTSADQIIVTSLGVILFIHALRFTGAFLGSRPGVVGAVGKAIGATVQFGG